MMCAVDVLQNAGGVWCCVCVSVMSMYMRMMEFLCCERFELLLMLGVL